MGDSFCEIPLYHTALFDDEIKLFDNQRYRVRKLDKWGVIDEDENEILSFKYPYISPLKDDVCIIRENKLLGIANQQGEIVIQPEYSKIQLKGNRAKAEDYKVSEKTIA